MFFDIEPSNGVPIYDQIVRQVKYAVADRSLRSGQRLPSVRELATQLAVNPNTVVRAMNQLRNDGVVESQRGRGMIVAAGALEQCRRDRRELLATRIEDVLTEALRSGWGPDEILRVVERKLKTLPAKLPPAITPETESDS